MREILFKGKCIDCSKWIEGCYVRDMSRDNARDLGKFAHKIQPLFQQAFAHPVDPDTICQSTEMKAYWDGPECKTEKALVWEHDLLEIDYEGKKIIAEVKYECGTFILASNEFADWYIPLFDIVDDCGWIDAKVIGNKIDNPELINVKNEHELE